MSERFVIVHRSFDPVQAELLGDILRDAGLAARVIGTRSGAAIGVGQVIMELHIEVPTSQAGQATDFLEAYFATDGQQLLREAGELDEDDDDSDDEDAAPASPRRAVLAAGVALVMPLGAGHVYARRPWTAAVLAAAHVVGIRYLFSHHWVDMLTGGLIFAFLVAADVVGAVRAVRAEQRGAHRSAAGQLVAGAVMALVAIVAARLIAPEVPRSRPRLLDISLGQPVPAESEPFAPGLQFVPM
jgi:hypothetical protein